MTRSWSLVLVVACGWTAGCRPAEPLGGAPDAPKVTASSTAAQQDQQQVALAARDAMFGRLSGKLMEVLGASGPVAAIEVCREQAPQIAVEAGERFGVAIGRTSFRLRNAKNAPPEWARPLVESRTAEPRFVALPDGQLGALLPIRLKPECLLCHGPQAQILPEIQNALKTHYPEDRATGFQAGDLRGWFWVTVPAGVRLPQPSSTSSANEGGEP